MLLLSHFLTGKRQFAEIVLEYFFFKFMIWVTNIRTFVQFSGDYSGYLLSVQFQ